MRTFFLTCAVTVLLTPLCTNVASAQPAVAATSPPAIASADAETPMSDAWFAKFAPRPDHIQNAIGHCVRFQGHTICPVGGGVPSHGKTTTLKKKHR